ncbi:MAG: hypothetical protein EA370_17835 [Wenzhouxiangella sp.]|nr:MAG: hypothetical protein EA370_17835 [Wenzhouxiangella sp.]
MLNPSASPAQARPGGRDTTTQRFICCARQAEKISEVSRAAPRMPTGRPGPSTLHRYARRINGLMVSRLGVANARPGLGNQDQLLVGAQGA